MGQGIRFQRPPDGGPPMTTGAYNEYMSQTYLPQQGFNASANAPIPGVTGPLGTATQVPGLTGIAPPQQQIPYQQQMGAPFRPMGQYGNQAVMLAGLLSPSYGGGYPNGLLGGKRPFVPGGK